MSEQSLLDGIPPDQIKEKPTHPRFRDLEGQRFGRWSVLAYGGVRNRKARWWCRCDCGETRRVTAESVLRGKSTSCGCYQRERSKEHNSRPKSHGLTGQPFFSLYRAVKGRCHQPRHPSFARYGGRGISMHPAWLENPAVFMAYVGSLPFAGEPGLSLDRIDNDGNYEPGNLRWATSMQQGRNTRRNVWLTRSDGKKGTLSDWARWLGMINAGGIRKRLRLGWPLQDALWTPKGCARRSGPVE